MARFIALFRGINVGRAKRIAMADLRRLLEALGHTQVVTLLNSGNVVFSAVAGDAAGHARAIQAAVEADLGISTAVMVLAADDFAAARMENSLLTMATDSSRLLVAFPQEPAALTTLAGLADRDWSPDVLAIGSRAAYLWCAGGIIESKLVKAVERQLGGRVTTRNWATVEKIGALLEAAPA